MNPAAHALGAALLCGSFFGSRIQGSEIALNGRRLPPPPGDILYVSLTWACFVIAVLLVALMAIALRTWFEEAQGRRTYNNVLVELIGSLLPIRHPPDAWYSPPRMSRAWTGRATLGVLTHDRRRLGLSLMLVGLASLGAVAFDGLVGSLTALALYAGAGGLAIATAWRTRSRHTMLSDAYDAGLRFLIYVAAAGAVQAQGWGTGGLSGQWPVLSLPALGVLFVLLWLKAGPDPMANRVMDAFD